MKKMAFCFLWIVVLWFGALVVGSAIVGGVAGSNVKASSMTEGYEQGHAAGAQAGAEFGKKYGGIILLGALIISVGGTVAGVLPGTKSKKASKDS